MRNILLFIFVAFGCVLTVCSQEDPYDMFEKDVISPRNNRVFTAVAFLHKPHYVFGYERKLSPTFALSAGVIILQNHTPYKIPLSGFEMNEDARFLKARVK